MALQLVEIVPTTKDRTAIQGVIDHIGSVATSVGGELIEAQVTSDATRAFVIVEHDDSKTFNKALTTAGIDFAAVDPVRLVGAELDDVKAARTSPGEYLVEWDLPEGLTMDTYLERKKASKPLYATVPEAQFLRTYVREDLAKCLCFYDGEDEGAVRKAREVVSAPVDRFHHLDQ